MFCFHLGLYCLWFAGFYLVCSECKTYMWGMNKQNRRITVILITSPELVGKISPLHRRGVFCLVLDVEYFFSTYVQAMMINSLGSVYFDMRCRNISNLRSCDRAS